MSDRITLYDDNLRSIKLAKKINGIWIDATDEIIGYDTISEENDEEIRYPAIKSKDYVEYLLYYPVKIPVRDSNFTMWFGTNETVRENIKFGLYSLDFNPILEYDSGIIEDSEDFAVFYPDDLCVGKHWFQAMFNEAANTVTFQMKEGDGIDNPLDRDLSEVTINTHQLCYLGMRVKGNSNNISWVERLRVYYYKESVSAEIVMDKTEFKEPEIPRGVLKITSEFGDVVDYNQFTLDCILAHSPHPISPEITFQSHTDNNHQFVISGLEPSSNNYTVKVTSTGDETFDSFTKSKNFKLLERTGLYIPFDASPTTIYGPRNIPVSVSLEDEHGNIVVGIPLKLCYKLTNSDTITRFSSTTDNEGVASWNITSWIPNIIEKYEVWVEFEGNDNYAPTATPHKLVSYVSSSSMNEKTGDGTTVAVKSPAHLTAKLVDRANNPLGNYNVRYDVIIGNVVRYAGTITSSSDGTLSLDYANNIQGDVDTIIRFTFEGDTANGILGTSTSFTVHWTKIDTSWSILEDESVTEVTNYLTFRARLTSTDGYSFAKTHVVRSILFTTLDGNSTNLIEMVDTLGNPISLTDLRAFYDTTSSNSIATFSAKSMVGDIKATVYYVYEGNELYNSSEISKVLQWNKIQTEILCSDIKIYSGRFTLFEDNPEADPSPGINENYKNFRATINPINTSNSYTVDEGTVTWKSRTSSTVYMDADVVNGKAEGRATSVLTNNANYRIANLIVIYSGSNKFKTANIEIQFITYKRVETKLKTTFDDIYNPPKRYNVPFNWRTDLTDTSDNGINNQKVKYYINNELKYTRTTNNQGLCTVQEYVPLFVGTMRVTTSYNEDDTVDKYLPKTINNDILIDKDTTTLVGSTDNVHTTCADAPVRFTLEDSLHRKLSGKEIEFAEDDGSGDTPTWTAVSQPATTNNNGLVTYTSEAYMAIKLVRGKFNGTEFYYGSENVQEVKYQMVKTFTANVTNGVANIPIDCAIDSGKGIPNGLYDVELEYLPPQTESGECPLYGPSVNTQYIRKKKPTYLACLTENKITEPYKPLYLTTELTNAQSEKLSNMKEWSYINGYSESMPPHITDANGQIVRGGWVSDLYDKLKYYFVSEQTKEYAPADLEVEAQIVKVTPTFLAFDLEGYSGVPMDLEAGLFHEYNLYDEYGMEIKQIPETGELIWYNPMSDTYYKGTDDLTEQATKREYDNAISITTRIPLPNKEVTWYGVDGKTVLASATTDEYGVALTTYTRVSVGTNTIYVGVEGDKDYQEIKKPIQLTTFARLPVYFEEIDFYETNAQGEYVRAAVYHHPTRLYTRLYQEIDGQRYPFANQEIQFSKDVLFGTATTDENGYVEFTHVVDSTVKYPYQVYFYSLGMYQSTKKVYRMPVLKQTPILTVTSSNNNPKVGDTITLTAKLTEDILSGKTPLPSRGITFFDGTDGLEYHKTESDGTCSMTYKLRYAGTHAIKAVYNTPNDAYNEVEGTLNLTVRKTNTHFETKVANPLTVPGLTSGTVKVNLKDAFNLPLQSKQTSITYNGQTLTRKTNGEGEITLETGKFEKDITKTMVFSFAGDDDYNSSTFTQTINWGEYLDYDNCTDLGNFEILTENYYASDGSAKWGLDVDGSYKNNTAPIQGVSGTPSCTKNGGTGVCLRLICGDLKTEGTYDSDSDSVAAPTGVVMRNKALVTSKKCTMRFKFMVKYDGVNNKKYSSSNDLIGGHLGLVTGNATTGERAPARFEFFRENAYFISDGGPAEGSSFRKKLYPNKEYSFEFKFNNNVVTGSLYDENGTKLQTDTHTCSRTFENLHPYVFAFTNGTAFVMRELRIIRED